jgi:hypothetical protein
MHEAQVDHDAGPALRRTQIVIDRVKFAAIAAQVNDFRHLAIMAFLSTRVERNGMPNPDPLQNAPDQAARQLFEKFQQLSAGRTADSVIGAAVNILINAIRQMEPFRKDAEARWDMLFGRGKSVLMDHYDATTGRKKSVIPHTQIIRSAFHLEDDEIRR